MLRVRWPGTVPYREALAVQQGLFDHGREDHLLLLEHPHVFTHGPRADLATNLRCEPSAVGADPVQFILGGGDDHPLLATFPEGKLPDGWLVVGTVAEGAGVTVDGEEYDGPTGWTHF